MSGSSKIKSLQCQSAPLGRFEIVTVSFGVSNTAGAHSGAGLSFETTACDSAGSAGTLPWGAVADTAALNPP
jgi:hypothetical protein